MTEFEREIPFWQALQTVFVKYGTEGWGDGKKREDVFFSFHHIGL